MFICWPILVLSFVPNEASRKHARDTQHWPGRLRDGRMGRTTTEIPKIQLEDWISNNPFLRNLAMFRDDSVHNSFTASSETSTQKIPKPEDDNFHWMYMDVNRTLFTQTDVPNEEATIRFSEKVRAFPSRPSSPPRLLPTRAPSTPPPTLPPTSNPMPTRSPPGVVLMGNTGDDTWTGWVDRIPAREATRDRIIPGDAGKPKNDDMAETPFQVSPDLFTTMASSATQALAETPVLVEVPSTTTKRPEEIGPPFYRIPENLPDNILQEVEMPPDVDKPFIGDSSTFEIPTEKEKETTKEPEKEIEQLTFLETTSLPPPLVTPPTPPPAPPRPFLPLPSDLSGHHRISSTVPPSSGFTLPRISIQRVTAKRIETATMSARGEWNGWNEDWGNPATREELILFSENEPTSTRVPSGILSPPPLAGPPANWGSLRNRPEWTKLAKLQKKNNAHGRRKIVDNENGFRWPTKFRDEQTSVPITTNDGLRYEVTGTKYYDDTRIHGSKVKSYGKSGTTKSSIEVEQDLEEYGRTAPVSPNKWTDKRYAMEMEIMKTKKLVDDMRKKSLPLKQRVKKNFAQKATKYRKENGGLSEARMVSTQDGRLVEERVSLVGGRMVTVDLSNPALHGHDLIAFPGSVIHENFMDDNRKGLHSNRRVHAASSLTDVDALMEKWKRKRGQGWSGTGELVPLQEAQRKVFLTPAEAASLQVEAFDSSFIDKPKQCCDGDIPSGAPRVVVDDEVNNSTAEFPLLDERRVTNGMYSLVNEKAIERNDVARDVIQEERQAIRECFSEKRNCYLIDASPLERRIGLNNYECLELCVSLPGCLSVSYSATLTICDIFNTRNGTGMANLVQLLGYFYYEPKTTSADKCLVSSRAQARAAKSQTAGINRPLQIESDQLRIVEPREDGYQSLLFTRSQMNLSLATGPRCGEGEEALFVRSKGVRDDQGSNLDTVLDINEDDCVFSCMSNLAGYYDAFDCVTAQYDTAIESCTLSSDVPRGDKYSVQPTTNFYEKMCVPAAVSRRCSGGTLDRRRQRVLVGLLRDSISVSSPSECIARCVDPESKLTFRCLSILFYYEEKSMNCVLNDGSAINYPEKMFEEKTAIMDYFGLDECHGIREITHTLAKEEKKGHTVHSGAIRRSPRRRNWNRQIIR